MSGEAVVIDVRGMAPAPQGSKRAYGNGRFAEMSPYLKDWRALVTTTAVLQKVPLREGEVSLRIEFVFPRPKSHFIGNKPGPDRLKPTAPKYHSTTPDLSKVLRSTEDALSGVAYIDDRMIVSVQAIKRYAQWEELPGAQVVVMSSIAASELICT